MQIDINVDMGESFGMYTMGNDAELMPHITTANVACGFHAGDPSVMRKTVTLAIQNGVRVGAHPSLPDLQGFGRREMKMAMSEIRDDMVYQIGALKAFVEAGGQRLQHVKPHGSLYGMMARSQEVSRAVCEAIREIDPNLFLYTMKKGVAGETAAEMGLRVVYEVFGDLDYDAEGNLVITRQHAVLKPEEVAGRVLRMVRDKKVTATTGAEIEIEGDSVCLHSDSPGALTLLKTVRRALEAAGYSIQAP
ncbi:MAG: 5-oxoprolinase subunit PxpA [Desulfobacterales bacterium]|jgi:5-oxoprolinase (ATP-hydrolysing) subunit A